MGKYDLISLE